MLDLLVALDVVQRHMKHTFEPAASPAGPAKFGRRKRRASGSDAPGSQVTPRRLGAIARRQQCAHEV